MSLQSLSMNVNRDVSRLPTVIMSRVSAAPLVSIIGIAHRGVADSLSSPPVVHGYRKRRKATLHGYGRGHLYERARADTDTNSDAITDTTAGLLLMLI